MAYFKQIVWFLIDVKVHQLHNAVYLLTSYVGLLCCFMELCFHLWLESSKGTFISWQPVVCDRCHIKTVFTFKLRLDTFCGNLLASFNSITGLIKTVILWGFYLEQWHVKKKKRKEKKKKRFTHCRAALSKLFNPPKWWHFEQTCSSSNCSDTAQQHLMNTWAQSHTQEC